MINNKHSKRPTSHPGEARPFFVQSKSMRHRHQKNWFFYSCMEFLKTDSHGIWWLYPGFFLKKKGQLSRKLWGRSANRPALKAIDPSQAFVAFKAIPILMFFSTLNYKKSCMESKLSTQLIIEPKNLDLSKLTTYEEKWLESQTIKNSFNSAGVIVWVKDFINFRWS